MHNLYGLLYVLSCLCLFIAVLVPILRRQPPTPIDLYRVLLALGLLVFDLVVTIAFLKT